MKIKIGGLNYCGFVSLLNCFISKLSFVTTSSSGNWVSELRNLLLDCCCCCVCALIPIPNTDEKSVRDGITKFSGNGSIFDVGLNPTSKFEILIGTKSLEIDDELIVIDPLRDKYVRLNSTAKYMWSLLLDRPSLKNIQDKLCEKYGLEQNKSINISKYFMNDLVNSGLVIKKNPN